MTKPIFNYPPPSYTAFATTLTSGTIAAGMAANSPIFSIRWTSLTKAFYLRQAKLTMVNDGTGFAAGSALFELFKATAFSPSDSGGTQPTLSGDAFKLNATQNTTGFAAASADLRIASTGTLTAGTRTLATSPFVAALGGVVTTAGAIILPTYTLFDMDNYDAEQPLVLNPATTAANAEGLVLRATVPATGTWRFSLDLKWYETT